MNARVMSYGVTERWKGEPMQTSRIFYVAFSLSLAAACSASETRPSSPDVVAAELACAHLPQGGAARPFANDAPGVRVMQLRADDLPTYDRETSDLRPDEPVGVRYSVAADVGSSQAWLERQIGCYRAALAGRSTRDPLLVADARVSVRRASGRYLFDVTSDDRQTASEVLRAAGR